MLGTGKDFLNPIQFGMDSNLVLDGKFPAMVGNLKLLGIREFLGLVSWCLEVVNLGVRSKIRPRLHWLAFGLSSETFFEVG